MPNIENTRMNDLMKRKVDIEEKIKEFGDILESNGNVGMTGEVIDKDGYPRSDIDIYQVRLARQQINRLQNDYKALMDQIELELANVHSQFKENLHNKTPVQIQKPILRVTQVDAGSPAHEAGIQLNDEIIQFGPYVYGSIDYKNLAPIAELVKQHENKIILLNVARENGETHQKEHVKIKLVPKKWCGHGLLGCKIVHIE